MKYYYIDTSSLKWRYLAGNPTSFVDGLLDDPSSNVSTSELALLEWSSALGDVYREGKINQATFKRNELALMTDIALGKLSILPPAPRIVERARYLIEYIGVGLSKSLKSGDAQHLAYSLYSASILPSKITFITSDKKLANIVKDVDIINNVLDIIYLAP